MEITSVVFVRNYKEITMVKKCDRIIPGSSDCKCVAQKGNCIFQKNIKGECAGKTGGIGSDIERGKKFAQQSQHATWAETAVAKVVTPPDEHHVFAHLCEPLPPPPRLNLS